MEVRSLEAVFGFKFDEKKLKQAIKSVDGFANNVNDTVNGLAKKMPLEVGIDLNSRQLNHAQNQIDNFSQKSQKALGLIAIIPISKIKHLFLSSWDSTRI